MEAVKGWGCSRAMEAQEFVMAAGNKPGDELLQINDDEGHIAIVTMFRAALNR
jgi:hypothetical protein